MKKEVKKAMRRMYQLHQNLSPQLGLKVRNIHFTTK